MAFSPGRFVDEGHGTFDESTGRVTFPSGIQYEVNTGKYYLPSKDGSGLVEAKGSGMGGTWSSPWATANINDLSKGPALTQAAKDTFNNQWSSISGQTSISAEDFQKAMQVVNSTSRSTNFLTHSVLPAAALFAGGVALGGLGGAAAAGTGAGSGTTAFGAPVGSGLGAGGAAATTAGSGGAAAAAGVNSGGALGSGTGVTGALGGGGSTAAAGASAAGGAGSSIFSGLGKAKDIANIVNAVGTVGGLVTAATTKPPAIPTEGADAAAARASQLEDLARADAALNSVRKRSQMGRYGARAFRTSAFDRLGGALHLQRATGPTQASPTGGLTHTGGTNRIGGPQYGFRVPTRNP